MNRFTGFLLKLSPFGYRGVINTQISVYNRLKKRMPTMPENELLNKLITSRIKAPPRAGPNEEEYYAPLLQNPNKTLEDVIWEIIEYEFILSRAEEARTKGQKLGFTSDQTMALWKDFEAKVKDDIRESVRKKVAKNVRKEDAGRKQRVSKAQFAELLYIVLSKQVTDKAVRKTAELFEFKIRNSEDFLRIFRQIFVLNMWLTVHTCERVFENENKRNECLDIFHHLVYKGYTQGTEEDFDRWWTGMGAIYIEYEKAMQTEHDLGPLWVASKLVNQKLFGELKEDPFLTYNIGAYMASFIEHMGEEFKKYEIE